MSKGLVLVLLFLAAIFILAAGIYFLWLGRQKAKEAGPGVPPSRRPGPADEPLEGRLLERYQLAGAGLTLALAILMPILYLQEPSRQAKAKQELAAKSVEEGRATFEQFCARCHGAGAQGGVVKRYVFPNQPGAKPADYPVPNLHEIWQRHQGQDVAAVAWDTIQHGRPPTPMPTWGIRYGGPMNDQQITNLVNYLLTIQSDNKKRPQLQFKASGPPDGPSRRLL